MISWDIFDTLIGRKCGTATRLFEILGERAGISKFVERRIDAEKHLQARRIEYTLEDIYRELGHPKLAVQEWNLEKEMVFPIAKTLRLFNPKTDIMVSDMYLGEERIRELLTIAGIEFDGPLYVSCYGKHSGTIWPQIRKEHRVTSHRGDNQNSDVLSPRPYGINGIWIDTEMTKAEKYYAHYHPDLARWIRYQRLRHIASETDDKLHLLQIEYNFPLLWSMAYLVNQYALATNTTPLFMSRDTQLLSKMYTGLGAHLPQKYIYTSRDALRRQSKNYLKYINSLYTKQTFLVDLTASLGSLKAILPALNHSNPKIFIGIHLKQPFNVDITGIDATWITTNMATRINNTYVEMLNYGTHWHVSDVDKRGQPMYDLEGEYDMLKVEEYHKLIEFMIQGAPLPSGDVKPIFIRALEGIQAERNFIGHQFPRHIAIERQRKKNLVDIRPKDDMVIVGAIHTYRWDSIVNWWKSLIATGFTGELHMMCYGIDTQTRSRLQQYKFNVHVNKLEGKQVVVDRFRDLAKLLENFGDRWVLFPDVGDLVFQWNPISFLSTVKQDIVVAHEGVTFSQNRWMMNNLETSFPSYVKQLRDKYFYNAGTMAARANIFKELAEKIYDLSVNEAETEAKSHDQTAANILLYQKHFSRRTLFLGPNDMWAYNAASSMFAEQEDAQHYKFELPTIKNGRCITGDIIPCMFHHYPRNKEISRQVRNRVNFDYAAFLRDQK